MPDIKCGDRVLLKQKKTNKLSTPYEIEPYTVDQVNGSQITATNDIHQVTRHVNLFKKLYSREKEEEEVEHADEDVMQPNTLHSTPEEPSPTDGEGQAQEPLGMNPMPRTDQVVEEANMEQQEEADPRSSEPAAPLRRSQRNRRSPDRYPGPERDTSQ